MKILLLLILISIFNTSISALDFIDYPIVSDERIKLTKKFVKRHYGLDNHKLINPKMIVIHYTSIGTVDYSLKSMKNPHISEAREKSAIFGKLNTSSHYLVTSKAQIYRILPSDMIARHTVGYDHVSLAIDNVATQWSSLTKDQINANVDLIAYLVKKYPSIKYLIGHHEYMMIRSPHYKLFNNQDPDLEPPIHIDPGFEFMDKVRKELEKRHNIVLLK